ncbi:acetyl-CoA carboxylase biotin carboxyl carrier protein [Hydrogenobaculum acidophilum]
MDLEPILALIKALDNSSLQKLKLTSGDFTLELEKGQVYIPENISEEIKRVDLSRQKTEHIKEEAPSKPNYHVIKSPLVGTFYRAPSPEAPPFVEVGDIISPGQTLCIIEALKVMNEIESDIKGRIESILVENGEVVEYGQPLFEISPL